MAQFIPFSFTIKHKYCSTGLSPPRCAFQRYLFTLTKRQKVKFFKRKVFRLKEVKLIYYGKTFFSSRHIVIELHEIYCVRKTEFNDKSLEVNQ